MFGLVRLKGVISRSRGAALILVHETTKEWSADHRTGRGWDSAGRYGWSQVETAARPVPVVVLDVLLKYKPSHPANSPVVDVGAAKNRTGSVLTISVCTPGGLGHHSEMRQRRCGCRGSSTTVACHE
jgi:hypothetical protein